MWRCGGARRLGGVAAVGLALVVPVGVTPPTAADATDAAGTAAAADAAATAGSPRRAAVAFARETEGEPLGEIWTMDRFGGTQRRLTFSPREDAWPSWSPDGSRIAWVRASRELWVMDADGTDKQLLHQAEEGADVADPSWAPTGERLVFQADRTLWVIDQDGSDVRPLIEPDSMSALWPDWSPDGRWIVFSGNVASEQEIWLVRPDGSQRHVLRHVPSANAWPAWSPDGERIAFIRGPDNSLALMRRNGTRLRNIVEGASTPSWSPYGSALVFTGDLFAPGGQRIYRTDLRGDDVRRLGDRAGTSHDYTPDYRPLPELAAAGGGGRVTG